MILFPIRLRIFSLAIMVLVMPYSARAQETCLDNSYVVSARPGKISVTDRALTYSYSNCPTSQIRLPQRVQLRAGQSLFFWFRVQGDRNYLASPQSRYPFILSFFRDNGSVAVDEGVISMKTLDRQAVLNETALTGGVFDWRLGAQKWQFDIPGNYQIHLAQQGAELDCLNGSALGGCTIFVEVVP